MGSGINPRVADRSVSSSWYEFCSRGLIISHLEPTYDQNLRQLWQRHNSFQQSDTPFSLHFVAGGGFNRAARSPRLLPPQNPPRTPQDPPRPHQDHPKTPQDPQRGGVSTAQPSLLGAQERPLKRARTCTGMHMHACDVCMCLGMDT